MIDLADVDLSQGAVLELVDGEFKVISVREAPSPTKSAVLAPVSEEMAEFRSFIDEWLTYLGI